MVQQVNARYEDVMQHARRDDGAWPTIVALNSSVDLVTVLEAPKTVEGREAAEEKHYSLMVDLWGVYERAVRMVGAEPALGIKTQVASRLFKGFVTAADHSLLTVRDLERFLKDTRTEAGLRSALAGNKGFPSVLLTTQRPELN